MNRTILLVHSERRTQRVVPRVLRSLGYRVEVAGDLAEAAPRLAEPPVLLVADSQAGVGELLAAAHARGTACLLLDADPASTPAIAGPCAVTNLQVHAPPLLGEALTIAAQKLIRRDLFGAEKYLLWGAELHATTLTRASQRAHLVGELADQVRARGHSARVASAVMLVADELVSNAVHNAPVDERGVHYRADLARDRELELDDRHQVALRWGSDGRYLAVEVTDRFGSLERDTVLRALVRKDVKDSGGGAGMGIALTYRSCDHLVFNLSPGERTQVIALVDVRHAQGERAAACSYNVFVER